MATATGKRRKSAPNGGNEPKPVFPGQVVLVLQGGGALGAYQVGVYEALHEAGIEPDWVIGTSIGAINAALIAGNTFANRLLRLREFWSRVQHNASPDLMSFFTGLPNMAANLSTVSNGIPGFFVPNPVAWMSSHVRLGVENAAYYSTAPLRETLAELVEFDCNSTGHTRLTVGAVNARNGEMRYFDSRKEEIRVDHILASGANVNVLVLDTEVYSNTGGQASKSTPLGAVAKFASSGKTRPRKNLGQLAIDHKRVYVAQIAMGGGDAQTVKAFLEAEAYPGVSIILAYSHCIAHGIDMTKGMNQQKLAVNSGHWPLYRYDPRLEQPMQLDSKAPSIPLREYRMNEMRFRVLTQSHPAEAEAFLHEAELEVRHRWRELERLAAISEPRETPVSADD